VGEDKIKHSDAPLRCKGSRPLLPYSRGLSGLPDATR
jgi:hypothetical protein